MPGPHNLLHIQDVYKSYNESLILDNIDLSVASGEFCTVVGPSGCGKSTMLRLILGQEEPTSGAVMIDGKLAGFANCNRGIVYQKYSLFPNKTVLENVLLGKKLGKNKKLWRRNRQEVIDEAMHFLDSVKLAEHAKKYPHELSGGMQQRVAVMQALIMKPKILLMDEPFGALDPGTRESLQLFLLELWKKNKMTIFFVTHDLEEAVFLGTRLLVFSRYYTDNRGELFEEMQRGAKIVSDYCIKHIEDIETSRSEKLTAHFGELIEEIRHDGFDPHYLQHVNNFKLTHQHSFQTLTKEESNRGE